MVYRRKRGLYLIVLLVVLTITLGISVAAALSEGIFTDIVITPDPIKIGNNANINITTSQDSSITVNVYNEAGVLVKNILNNTTKSAGTFSQTWDGKDNNGTLVPDGRYKFTFEAKDNSGTTLGQAERTVTAARLPSISNVSDTNDPFNPLIEKSTISYSLSSNSLVSISIYNGYVPIRTLTGNQLEAAGNYSIQWDGKDDNGSLVGDGVYTYQIDAVSPLVDTFKSTSKSTITLDKEAPSITDFNVYPDPFKLSINSLNINYNLSENSKVTIKVKNSMGNVVYTILDNISKNTGYNSISWNGMDSSGRYIPEGQYSIVISAIDSLNKSSTELSKPFTAGYVPAISNVSTTNNPFNPLNGEQSSINFTLSNDALVTVTILNGYNPIRTIIANVLKTAGTQSIIWDGKDNNGNLAGDATYTYQIDAVSRTVDTFKSTFKGSVVLDKEKPQITDLNVTPDPLKLGTNNATIGYTLSEDSKVTVKVLDSTGNLVQTILSNAAKNVGYNSISWDGKDSTGKLVNEGQYTITVNAVDYCNNNAIAQTKTITAAYLPSITNVNKFNDPFNPLNGEKASIDYAISNDALVSITIYSGYIPVRTIAYNNLKLAGAYSFTWDGKDDSGNLLGDATYTYQIDAVDPAVSYFKSTYKSTVTLEKSVPQISDFSLNPNPFTIGTSNLSIRFTLSEGAKVNLKVVDNNGNLVKTVLDNVDKNAGYNNITWDGKDINGNYIQEGIYDVVISATDNFNKTSEVQRLSFSAGNSLTISNVSDGVDPFNPLNENSIINYSISNKALVTVTIYNGLNPVRTLTNNELKNGGAYSVIWDGKDDFGNLAGDGTYTYQIDAVSPTVSSFKTTVKGTTTLDKEAPTINDFTVYPDPIKLSVNSLNVSFILSENAKVTMKILDSNGNLIKTILENEDKKAGFNKITWDGKNSSGDYVTDGTYKVVVNAIDGLNKPSLEKSQTFTAAFSPSISNVLKLNDPFNPKNQEQVQLNYVISSNALVTVTIYNGFAPIRTIIANQPQIAGTNSISWDGKDDAGNIVEDGTYSYQIDTVNSLVSTFKNTYKDNVTVEANNPTITNLVIVSNPVKVETSAAIKYSLSEFSKVKVEIIDQHGAVIKEFPQVINNSGQNSLTWDTKDNSGNFVPSGNYTVKVTAVDNFNKTGSNETILQVNSGPVVILTSSDNQVVDFSSNIKTANISYTISEKSNVTISIYNSKNELWRQLFVKKEVLDSDSVSWDGRSSDGRIIADTYTFIIDSESAESKFPGKQVKGIITLSNVLDYLTKKCTDCHTAYPSSHPVTNCDGCHGGNKPVQNCYNCHSEWSIHSTGAILASYNCVTCHNETYSYKIPMHVGNEETIHVTSTFMDKCISCHKTNLISEHLSRTSRTTGAAIDCNTCHQSTKEQVITAIANKNTSCDSCHLSANHEEMHISSLSPNCFGCHNKSISVEHVNRGLTCDTCHKNTDPNIVSAIKWGDLSCTGCHKNLHGLNSGKTVPVSIPKYSNTISGNNLKWLQPTSTEFWKDESWFPLDMDGGYLTLTNRNSNLTGEEVYNYYVTEMSKLGWKKEVGPSTPSPKFELVFTKEDKKAHVRFYNTSNFDSNTTVTAGYRIEIIYK